MRLCEEMKGNGTGTQPNANRETYPGIVCFWKSRWQQKGYSALPGDGRIAAIARKDMLANPDPKQERKGGTMVAVLSSLS